MKIDTNNLRKITENSRNENEKLNQERETIQKKADLREKTKYIKNKIDNVMTHLEDNMISHAKMGKNNLILLYFNSCGGDYADYFPHFKKHDEELVKKLTRKLKRLGLKSEMIRSSGHNGTYFAFRVVW
jgi:hypothetical protein